MVREPGILEIPAEMERCLENLCELCRQFDFDSLGLKPRDFPLHHEYLQTVCSHDFRPEILEIQRRAGTCIICKEVFDFYNHWRSENKALLDFNQDRIMVDSAQYFMDKLIEVKDGLEIYKLVRMFVQLDIKKFGDDDFYSPLLQFQKWIPDWSTKGNGKSAVEQPYNGRMRAVLVDQTQLLDWKKDCDRNHGNSCKSDTNIMNHLDFIRLVDIQERCVTVKKGGELANLEYAALSYVWGGKDALGGLKMPKLMYRGENCEEALRQRGALKPEKVLRTIDDAMTFVGGGLKLKYLWVDCLCILQAGDDNISDNDTIADQKKFINAMDSIYACALVTIVAAAGDNANAGLPGINRQHVPERMEQNPLQIQKRDKPAVSIVRTLDLEGSGVIEFPQYRYLEGSTWDTRGWTFQEKIFSRRSFIFTKMQVYWECQTATWCEDSIWETTNPLIYRHCFSADEFRLPWNNINEGEFEGKYRKLVEEYTRRKLTHESDCLNAFTGIMNALGRGTGDPKQEFKWGLPLSFLANALKWRGNFMFWENFVLERSTKEHFISTKLSCPFPSWSWVGWVGKVKMGYSLEAKMLGLHFYFLPRNGCKLVMVECSTICLDSLIQRLKKPDERMDVHINDGKVQKALPKSIASNILFFWSSAARFYIRVEPNGFVTCSRKIATNNIIEVVIKIPFHRPLLPPESTHAEYKLVVIGIVEGMLSPFNEEVRDELAVLVCSENENQGVVYRKGLIQISITEWKTCEPEWELICLG
ncbi:hypothetical protein M758_10G070800 [Ceratodon purpureus]|nr:hypothetical protein M758_10G070800 [Ceratodon purpureus]